MLFVSLLGITIVTFTQCTDQNKQEDIPAIFLVSPGPHSDTTHTFGCGDRLIRKPLDKSYAESTKVKDVLSRLFTTQVADSLANAAYQPELSVKVEKHYVDSTLVIHLSGHLIIGGLCDNPRLQRQLKTTASQFDRWKRVKFYINNQPLASYTDLRGRPEPPRGGETDSLN